MPRHAIQWTTPAPLWGEVTDPTLAAVRTVFRRPALLRFAHDAFMEEFLALLAAEPQRLDTYRARPETWRAPLSAPDPPALPPPLPESLKRRGVRALLPARAKKPVAVLAAKSGGREMPLKLYQPGHQRHYLVSACLVCRLPGLPDRALESARQETAAFVVRRLMPPPGAKSPATPDGSWVEYAFVGDGRTAAWEKVVTAARPTADVLVPA